MVVVAIIGILMAAGIVAFSGAQRAARDAQRRADIDAIGKAFEQVYTSTTDYDQGWIWYCGWNSTSGT